MPSPTRLSSVAAAALAAALLTACDGHKAANVDSGTGGAVSSGGATGSGGAVSGSGGATGSGGGAPAGSPVDVHGQLHVCGTKICDKNDQPVQLKGVSSFWLSWATGDRAYALDKDGLKWMRDTWKLQIIRGAMGVDGNSNYMDPYGRGTSLTLLDAVIRNAIEVGVYVIVDWHSLKLHPDAATGADAAVEFFAQISKKYGGYPNVLWEDYNEPTREDWSTVLKPYHVSVVNAIRANDPDNIIILGTPNWSQYVDLAANDPVPGSNLLYTLHFYSCDMGAALRARADTAIAKGIGLFITEWGATKANGGTDLQTCLPEASNWMTWATQNGIGWTVWRLDACTNESTCMLTSTSCPQSGPYTSCLGAEGNFVAAEIPK